MKLPNRIMILGERYKVQYVDKPVDECGKPVDGLMDPVLRTIEIDSQVVDLERIFLHECIHAVIHEVGIDMPDDAEEILTHHISKFIADKFIVKLRSKA